MSNWRGYILQHFQTPSHRLTLVADPDGLMLEEQLLATIRVNGFQLLRFDDPIQFRYAYETQFRSRWDAGEETDLVVVLRSPDHDLRHLPFDLLQAGRQLKFQLSDLFPKLSYPIVAGLDHSDLDRLYDAYETYRGGILGDHGTQVYLLQNVFGVSLDTFRLAPDVLNYLLARHYAGRRVPSSIDHVLLERLRQIPATDGWPLASILSDRTAFFDFLQRAWPRFLAGYEMRVKGTHESKLTYSTDVPLLPLDEPETRAFVDSLFLDGYLHPIPVPDDWDLDSWTNVGVLRQPEVQIQRNFQSLAKIASAALPDAEDTHQVWLKFARTWAKLVTTRHALPPSSPLPNAVGFDDLQLAVEAKFAVWTQHRYLGLHNYPPLPRPVMLHQISHYLAWLLRVRQCQRIALIVIDGLAWGQWLLIEDRLVADHSQWSFDSAGIFAWVPTLTGISRQSIFAAETPLNFASSWSRTDGEPNHWARFWADQQLPEQAIGYFKGANLDEHEELDAWLQDQRGVVAGLVVGQVDEIMHGMQLGTAGMQQQVQLWAEQGHLARLIQKLSHAGFTVFITADHGNIAAQGIGRPQQGMLVEDYAQRALQFSNPAFLAQAQQQYPEAIRWQSDGLPQDVHVLLANGLTAFDTPQHEVVCHGGISLEEVIVPFVRVVNAPL